MCKDPQGGGGGGGETHSGQQTRGSPLPSGQTTTLNAGATSSAASSSLAGLSFSPVQPMSSSRRDRRRSRGCTHENDVRASFPSPSTGHDREDVSSNTSASNGLNISLSISISSSIDEDKSTAEGNEIRNSVDDLNDPSDPEPASTIPSVTTVATRLGRPTTDSEGRLPTPTATTKDSPDRATRCANTQKRHGTVAVEGSDNAIESQTEKPMKQASKTTSAVATWYEEFRTATTRRIPCKARGMDESHNADTAYFVVHPDTPHGELLTCSYPPCAASKRRFRYCTKCKTGFAERNFIRLHGHGLISTFYFLDRDAMRKRCGTNAAVAVSARELSAARGTSGGTPSGERGAIATRGGSESRAHRSSSSLSETGRGPVTKSISDQYEPLSVRPARRTSSEPTMGRPALDDASSIDQASRSAFHLPSHNASRMVPHSSTSMPSPIIRSQSSSETRKPLHAYLAPATMGSQPPQAYNQQQQQVDKIMSFTSPETMRQIHPHRNTAVHPPWSPAKADHTPQSTGPGEFFGQQPISGSLPSHQAHFQQSDTSHQYALHRTWMNRPHLSTFHGTTDTPSHAGANSMSYCLPVSEPSSTQLTIADGGEQTQDGTAEGKGDSHQGQDRGSLRGCFDEPTCPSTPKVERHTLVQVGDSPCAAFRSSSSRCMDINDDSTGKDTVEPNPPLSPSIRNPNGRSLGMGQDEQIEQPFSREKRQRVGLIASDTAAGACGVAQVQPQTQDNPAFLHQHQHQYQHQQHSRYLQYQQYINGFPSSPRDLPSLLPSLRRQGVDGSTAMRSSDQIANDGRMMSHYHQAYATVGDNDDGTHDIVQNLAMLDRQPDGTIERMTDTVVMAGQNVAAMSEQSKSNSGTENEFHLDPTQEQLLSEDISCSAGDGDGGGGTSDDDDDNNNSNKASWETNQSIIQMLQPTPHRRNVRGQAQSHQESSTMSPSGGSGQQDEENTRDWERQLEKIQDTDVGLYDGIFD